MKMSKVLLLTIAGMLAFGTWARAEEGMGPGDRDGQAMAEAENKIGMTPEQSEKVKALREDFASKQKAVREEVKAKHEALRKELDSDNPDRTKAQTLANDISKLQGEAMSSRIDNVFALRAILTPEQFKKLRQMREEHRDKMQENGKGKFEGKRNRK